MHKKPTSCYCLKLRRTTGNLTRFYDKMLEPSEVTVSQYGLLLNISKAENGSLRELADMAELDRSTLARNIKPLIKKRLVCDTKADGARDSKLVLTRDGEKTLLQAAGLWSKAQEKIKEALGENGIIELEKMLKALEAL
ncbi:DNA-binding transcriptional regulator, MarR family [Anaerocolumna jejuensis DSM 15929]|uniref:DNA-binding transcriptional regulator, MarR family n=1 Tax=Anaerocolumna jejuensis DSM 15929 TaxID=1121322 RepID=A0A1M6TD50_9FIRM|nr:MarR family winged helix-turn-helix transcriptional regulator [Anaerocolumna jejuensis]SHK54809.1 DNA-binding transcriptional regulator, MarR family [Anaerocolumna jejuensis DSM 15929]